MWIVYVADREAEIVEMMRVERDLGTAGGGVVGVLFDA